MSLSISLFSALQKSDVTDTMENFVTIGALLAKRPSNSHYTLRYVREDRTRLR